MSLFGLVEWIRGFLGAIRLSVSIVQAAAAGAIVYAASKVAELEGWKETARSMFSKGAEWLESAGILSVDFALAYRIANWFAPMDELFLVCSLMIVMIVGVLTIKLGVFLFRLVKEIFIPVS